MNRLACRGGWMPGSGGTAWHRKLGSVSHLSPRFENLNPLQRLVRPVGANRLLLQRHYGWDRVRVRRGRPGLAGSAPSGLVAVGVPAANSLSRIFVRVGNGLNGPTFTIPDSMPGSLDCAARELQSPGYSVDTVTHATMPQAVDGLRNSSTTVMRRMLASIKSVEEVLGGGLLLIRH